MIAPILILLIFGGIGAAYALMARHTISIATREGAREASLPGVTEDEVQAQVDSAMAASGLTGYTTTMDISGAAGPAGPEVWVEISLPVAIPGPFFSDGAITVTSRVTMHK